MFILTKSSSAEPGKSGGRRKSCRRRAGAVTVEFAFIAQVLFLVILAVAVGGIETYRYQQMASLARDCARWASVHGGQWAADKNGGTLTTQSDVFNNVFPNRAMLVNTTTLSNNSTVTWDNSSQMPTVNGTTNRVHVTLSYPLNDSAFPLMGKFYNGITLTATSEKPISY